MSFYPLKDYLPDEAVEHLEADGSIEHDVLSGEMPLLVFPPPLWKFIKDKYPNLTPLGTR